MHEWADKTLSLYVYTTISMVLPLNFFSAALGSRFFLKYE